ncbi:uncharacterized protein VTP21DRAFT_3399 [Calcarisporiella thermophila]|uniref:uncharacterized protein n=1 Tax=Calcarisporiella thermophila TaxID=911321 RepID=UPI003743CF0C
MQHKVAIVGSGNWGSAISKIIGTNVKKQSDFSPEVRMWVYEEELDGEKLTHIINTKHENVKYLPGITLPDNVVAVPELLDACEGATILVFVLPHQFVKGVCKKLEGHVSPNCKGISLIKGLETSEGMGLISHIISNILKIEMSVLSGANIANEVAAEKFCETTIGSPSRESGELFRKLFHTSYFLVSVVDDVNGVELFGALKNIIAIAAGITDGLEYGDNTKAAIIRMGMLEILKFGKKFYEGVKSDTIYQSCGIADLITTCYGGRNRKVAEAHARTGKSFEELEKEMLNGQKLQGTLTAKEVYTFLKSKQLTQEFPLMTTVYRVCYEDLSPSDLFKELARNYR